MWQDQRTGWKTLGRVLTVGVLALTLGGFALANLLYTPPEISLSERRRLASMPSLVQHGGLNKKWTTEYEAYAQDSFIFRDGFRRLKSLFAWNIYRQTDINGIYLVEDMAAKIQRVDEASVQKGADKIKSLAQTLEGLRLYYTLIPDKGVYLSQAGGVPAPGHGRMEEILAKTLTGVQEISLLNTLSAEDYYKTDLHWDQSRLDGVVAALGQAMGFEAVAPPETHTLQPFYGVYYGQSALPLSPEVLHYRTGGVLDRVIVKMLNPATLEMEESRLYHPEELGGIDPYNVFLGGAQPLITLENPDNNTGRQLYLFRDSFGSSLAPLLVSAYQKITLIDLRYLASPMLSQLVEFAPGSDVLFAYSDQIINNSAVLLIKE